MLTRKLAMLLTTLAFISSVQAHEYELGDIEIDHPFARATAPGQTSGSIYVELENDGKTNDKLIKAETSIAKSVQLHSMELVSDVMKMREVNAIELSANSKVDMEPGGKYHIMLIDLVKPLKTGETFPLTLHFEKAGKITVTVTVEAHAKGSSIRHHH